MNEKSNFIKYCKKCGKTIPVMLSRNNICNDCLINNAESTRNVKTLQDVKYNNKTNDG